MNAMRRKSNRGTVEKEGEENDFGRKAGLSCKSITLFLLPGFMFHNPGAVSGKHCRSTDWSFIPADTQTHTHIRPLIISSDWSAV